jgi:hypothetical protein
LKRFGGDGEERANRRIRKKRLQKGSRLPKKLKKESTDEWRELYLGSPDKFKYAYKSAKGIRRKELEFRLERGTKMDARYRLKP